MDTQWRSYTRKKPAKAVSSFLQKKTDLFPDPALSEKNGVWIWFQAMTHQRVSVIVPSEKKTRIGSRIGFPSVKKRYLDPNDGSPAPARPRPWGRGKSPRPSPRRRRRAARGRGSRRRDSRSKKTKVVPKPVQKCAKLALNYCRVKYVQRLNQSNLQSFRIWG